MLTPTLFSTQSCELGESPLWHKQRNSLFWVDILNKVIYEKAFNSKKEDYDNQWRVPYLCSAIVEYGSEQEKLYLLTEHSFGWLCLKTGRYSAIIKLPISDDFRTNDAGVAPDGSFWFGTMQKHPNSCQGDIYSLTSAGKLIKQLTQIGIPNTFCWSNADNVLYLADSFRQKLFSYTIEKSMLQADSEKIMLDLSGSKATPDGGAMDLNNNLWNAQWDGAKVACYNTNGKLLQTIKMPVPKPTSCCFGGLNNRYLFITTAKEGMTNKECQQFPMSGNLFMLELPVSGYPIKRFYRESIGC